MKIYDFDAKFYDYVRGWMALHPGLKENEVEERYNEMMRSFLNAPAKWLDGQKPGEYFDRYSDPKDLMKLLEEYLKRDIGLPEPLYSRVVALGEACAPSLLRIISDPDKPENLRGTAIALLRDMDAEIPLEQYADIVAASRESSEISELVGDVLAQADPRIVALLMARYDRAKEYGRMLILDICSNYPEDPRVFDRLVHLMRTRPDERALCAALLAKLGDPRAIEPMKAMLNLVDLTYLDYIELRNAIEALGGDAGEERCFNGDPDYEALRGM